MPIRYYLIVFVLFIAYNTSAQVQVDPFTGSANVSIPLTTVNSKEISYPISASYNNGGIKVDDPTGNLGTGWYLNIQGSISRTVNDLPDDYLLDATSKKYGWMHKGTAELVQQMVHRDSLLNPLDSCSLDQARYQFLRRFGVIRIKIP